ncbi:phosphatidylinositol 4-kinase gamma-like protein [Actinidia rufa]|uniref:1-phosphatidylinositol 4-kinase n=1 Tax=Actinidia rufa TaxID=165716 RepID=A0A7J0FTL6_9ERIC|nr:phosphatidylinositol 4-kinase gamma-like protein [Actinidia rufa]
MSVGVALSPSLEPVHSSGYRDTRSGLCSDKSIVIYLTVAGSMIPMWVLESESIASVKLRIQTCKGFVVKKQKLVFGGRELARNDSLVKDYSVTEGKLLHLVLRLSDLLVITVRTACGKEFEFHVDRNRNVGLIDDICKNTDAVIHLVVQKSAKVQAKPLENDVELSVVAANWNETTDEEENRSEEELQVESRKPQIRDFMLAPVFVSPKIKLPSPTDEEPMAVNNPQGLPVSTNGEGLKRGTRVGEGALREAAAYILDHPRSGPRSLSSGEVGFAGVPPTVLARCLHRSFNHPNGYECAPNNVKIGSLQMFMKNYGCCEDMGPQDFPVEEVHKITAFDIRMANADRHAGNILVSREGEERQIVLIPIDHGYCLPENFEDCTFEWLYWPQAHQPYSPDTVDYIKSLDAERDIALLKFYGWDISLECTRTLRVSTMLLKKGVERGLTSFTIGSIMCRETLNKESVIEGIVREARESILPGMSEAVFLETVSQIMDFQLDKLEK